MSLLDWFRSGPETAEDLQKKQVSLQHNYESTQVDLQSAQARYNDSKGKLLAFNEEYGPILKIVAEAK